MKKFIALALALVMMLPSFNVFAAGDEELFDTLFNSKYLSGEVDFEMSIKPNTPLPTFIDADGSQTKILESSKYTYHIKYNASEDSKKLKAEMDMNISVPGFINMDVKNWVDMDLSDVENPVYKVITKQPDNDKYMYMDYMDNPVIPMNSILPEYIDNIGKLNEELFKNMDKSKFKLEYEDGKYSVVLDEATVKELLKNSASAMSDIFMKYFATASTVMGVSSSIGVIGSADGPTSVSVVGRAVPENAAAAEVPNSEALNEQYEKAISEFFEKLEKVQLFDEDAIVIKYEIDDKNLIKSQDITLNIKTNIAELMEVFGASDRAVTKENSKLDLSLNFHMDYSKINEPVDIVFPELTEENSINIFDNINRPVGPEGIIVIVDGEPVNFNVQPVIKDGRALVPLRAFIDAIGESVIEYVDGDIKIKIEDTSIELSIGSETAYVNGEKIILDVPAQLYESTTLVPARFIADALKYEINWVPFYNEDTGILYGGIVDLYRNRWEPATEVMIPAGNRVNIELLSKASDKSGIKAEIVAVPEEHYREKAMVMIAAGQPSVIMGNDRLDREVIQNIIDMDAMLPLDDLIEKFAPNIKIAMEKNPEIKKAVTYKDGKIYALPIIRNDGYDVFYIPMTVKNPDAAVMLLSSYAALISTGEAYDKNESTPLNIALPENSQNDTEALLKKVSDSTGINARPIFLKQDRIREHMNLMIAAGESCVFFNLKLEDNWKEQMFSQGVAVPLEDLIEKYAPNLQKFLEENPEFKNKITHKDGHIYSIPVSNSGAGDFFVSAVVKNPQTAIKWFDYFYTEEGQQVLTQITNIEK